MSLINPHMSKIRHHESPRKESHFTTGFFWGIVFGAIGVFLFGTKKGNKLKKYLSEHGEKVFEEFEEFYERVQKGDVGIRKLEGPKIKPKKTTKKQDKMRSEKKEPQLTSKPQSSDVSHISKLQERGRNVATKFFTRGGKTLR